MARNNLFLGTASGSVGDVTVMRRDGVQVSRVRVRSIANPKTSAQCAQRLKTPPVTKFYSVYAEPLNQSFEGLSKTRSYSALLKANLDDFTGPFVPKGSAFVPGPFLVSRGSLPVLHSELVEPAGAFSELRLAVNVGKSFNVAEFSQAMISQYGLQNGDQLTALYVVYNEETGSYVPGWTRFNLDISNKSGFGSIDLPGVVGFGAPENGAYLYIRSHANGNEVVAGCWIVSRRVNGIWRRSSQRMICADSVYSAYMSDAAYNAALASYGIADTANLGSEVYLNNANTSTPVITSVSQVLYGGMATPVLLGYDADGSAYAIVKTIVNADGSGAFVAVADKTGATAKLKDGNVALVNLVPDDSYKALVSADKTVAYSKSMAALASSNTGGTRSGASVAPITIDGVDYSNVKIITLPNGDTESPANVQVIALTPVTAGAKHAVVQCINSKSKAFKKFLAPSTQKFVDNTLLLFSVAGLDQSAVTIVEMISDDQEAGDAVHYADLNNWLWEFGYCIDPVEQLQDR